MDFVKWRVTAEEWSKVNDFKLIDSDAAESRLIFHCDSVSFYVLCHDGSLGRWNVWSEDGRVLRQMTPIQDYVHSCQKHALTEVLDFIQRALLPLARGEVEEEEGAACAPVPVAPPVVVDDDVDEGLEDDEEDTSYQEGDDESDDGGYDATYYEGDDLDVEAMPLPGPSQNQAAQNNVGLEPSQQNFFTGNANNVAVHRIMKDLKSLQSSEGQFGVRGSPRGDNLLVWDVELTDIPNESRLGRDLEKYAKKFKRQPVITLEMEFPPDYPMAPPFVRVVRPRFQFLTGHVTVGGSVCMEMLTRSGWRPTNDIESILVQIRSEILSDASTCLDERNADREYDKQEAKMAFKRMVQRYGWS